MSAWSAYLVVEPGGGSSVYDSGADMNILGLSAFYHDSAACLVRDGEIVAAAQEERFTRKKHDSRFPANAVAYCLREGGITLADLDVVVFYDKPLLKFERMLETYLAFAPRGIQSFRDGDAGLDEREAVPAKLLIEELIAAGPATNDAELPRTSVYASIMSRMPRPRFIRRPIEEAAVLCLDGVGEWATTSAWIGEGNALTPLWEIPFPHSLGLLYSAFTYYTGFKVNSGEYKVMGLAPYGKPSYVKADLRPSDRSSSRTARSGLNMEYFNYCTGLTMTNGRFDELFGGPPREPESRLTQREMDLARSIQDVTEEVMLRLARTLAPETGRRESLPGRRRGAQLRRQRPDPARGSVQGHLDSAGGRRCRRRAGRGAERLASERATAPQASDRSQRCDERQLSGAGVLE